MRLLTFAPTANKVSGNSSAAAPLDRRVGAAVGRVWSHFKISGRSELEAALVTFSYLWCVSSCI